MSEELRARLSTIDGVEESDSAFKDTPAYWVNGKEILHFEGASAVNVRLTRAVIRTRRVEFRADHRVRLRATGADWLTVVISEPADEEFVLELAILAAAAHRGPAGSIAPPAPVGADLARRRRLH